MTSTDLLTGRAGYCTLQEALGDLRVAVDENVEMKALMEAERANVDARVVEAGYINVGNRVLALG